MRMIEADWLQNPQAQKVCAMLTDAGHQAWFVGGCVRNALIDMPATDLDIATEAHPERVIELAEAAGLKPVPTGIDHGTVTVVAEGRPFEVTTFRRDVETDGRRAVVVFADSLEEDARRRDFTMNALYAAPDGRVTDPVGGLPDLEARRLRFIGDPHDRIREDYLRILRFFRFHAWYGEDLDEEGLAACASEADGIEGLSRERIGHEMRKLLAAPDPAPATAAMEQAGVLWRVLPGTSSAGLAPLVHLEGMVGLAANWPRRLAVLGGDGQDELLRLSRAEARQVRALQEAASGSAPAAELGYRMGADAGLDALLVRGALQGGFFDPNLAEDVRRGARQNFPISSADLAERYQGPALGRALRETEQRWIDSDFRLNRDELLK
ncbi:CCA tRNA nucleotidyltransferase [Histidinibacterium aquaticum]|uniref:CCA tRNA nucleotidyltransferase n=1 Tax=Histidinibacterium aquaticum TaxID=2613962 RepID=A0A5J5GH82_9RHOB|nr:CCA tRNA nucleotidyltransferase [Histidinibacterium aquaticum]KAA9006894.1 CCA tRNA nucleotidyltransferase [Histidinibacterium aquaticum]